MTPGRPATPDTDEAPWEDDDRLLRAAGAGDHRCWDRLVDEHLRSMWAAARSAGVAPDTAADACRTVWLRLGSRLSQQPFATEEPLQRWLHRAVVDECLRYERVRTWSRSAWSGGGTAEVAR